MQRFALLLLGAALFAVFLNQLAPGQQDSASDAKLRFVAEFGAEADGNGVLRLEVTFHGTQPKSDQAEEVLRNCLQAAIALNPSNDIAGAAWYRASGSDSDRQAITLANGAESLRYVAKEKAIRSGSGGAPSSGKAAQEGGHLTLLVVDDKVADACKDVPQQRVVVLAGVAAASGGPEHKHFIKAMRGWCRENNVTLSRDLRLCMSSISKAVLRMRDNTSTKPEDLPAAIARGADAYNVGRCGKCHLASGRGGQRGPDLTDSQWLHCDGSVKGIRKVLVSGVPSNKLKDASRTLGMDPATDLIPDENQLTDLAIYVHSLSQN